MKRRRVTIVLPRPDLDTVPSLRNAASLLLQHACLVGILTHVNPGFRFSSFNARAINVRVSRPYTLFRTLVRFHHSEYVRGREAGVLFALLRS